MLKDHVLNCLMTGRSPRNSMQLRTVVSFPDPAFTKDKGLAHFAQNLGLPDLTGGK